MFRLFNKVFRAFSSTQEATKKHELTAMARWFNQSQPQFVEFDKDTRIIGLPFEVSPQAIQQPQFTTIFNNISQSTQSIIVKSSCGANLGINRNFSRKSLQKALFSGIDFNDQQSQVNKNPQWPVSFQQMALLKPLLIEQDNQSDSQALLSTLQQKLMEQYEVQGNYVDFIIKAMMSSDNEVYLNGLSELVFRKAIAENYTLDTIKEKFVDYIQECQNVQNYEQFDVGRTFLKTIFQDTLVPLEDKFLYLTHSRIKGPKIIICDTFNIPGLQFLKQTETMEDAKKISSVKLYRPFLDPVKSPQVQSQNDQIMIEKHAILQCMISTDLWTQPYIHNMFPYLSQQYLKLSQGQQQTIKQRYRYHLNRYRAVRNKMLQG